MVRAIPDGLPVVLVGPMAVGKSAIGQQLAHQLRLPFVDTDAVVVAAHGSIADIFADSMALATARASISRNA
ncbi:hypothetical protein CQ024_16995, partial [Brevundimonas sp. MYb27]